MFWLAAGALVILALAFIVWPLAAAQAPPRTAADRRRMMRALYRDRVAEIEAETAAEQLDPETRGQVVDELGANLLAEYQAAAPAPDETTAPTSSGPRVAFWLLLLLLPVAGIGVYLSAGEPAAMELAGASEVLTLDPRSERAEIETWRARLLRRVERRPEDGRSWYLLGVSRLQLGEFAAAADAFTQAHQHVGRDPTIDLYWLQARYLAAGGELDEQSRMLAQRILQARPNHPLVLEMFAIDAYRRGEYRTAVEQLNRALDNPLPASQRAALLGGLDQARSRMGILTPSIDVDVTAPAGAPRNSTLFVIARPPGGGMPYAVVRRPAAVLPLSVRLDDTVSMSGQKLSDAEAIEVVVRLSRSGNPTAAPGDWEWRSEVLQVAELNTPVALEASLQPRTSGES
jgi:cytochrome c-type biogenesis protein CcmH